MPSSFSMDLTCWGGVVSYIFKAAKGMAAKGMAAKGMAAKGMAVPAGGPRKECNPQHCPLMLAPAA